VQNQLQDLYAPQMVIRHRRREHELHCLNELLELAQQLHCCPADAPAPSERSFQHIHDRDALYISFLVGDAQ
jgi:hypothetical protein